MSEEKVLVTVAGEAITEKDLEQYLEKLPQEQKAYASNPAFRQQVLDQIVNTRLMCKLGEEQKLHETQEFEDLVKTIRSDVLAQLAIQKLVDSVTVSEEECLAYYNEHLNSYKKPETVSAKHILVDTEEKALEIAEQLKSGACTFEEAAAEHSTCPSKAQGGDLGQFGHGQMVKEFDEAAFAAEVDSVTAPVKTQFGYHLIKVYAKSEPGVSSYEEVAENVKNTLLNSKTNQTIQTSLAELRARFLA